jgi:hypothetical protein
LACLPAGHHRLRSSTTGKVRRLPSQPHTQLLGIALSELPQRERGKHAGRLIWASSDNARYSVAGIRAGATLTAAEKALRHGYLFRVGLNYWYVTPVRGASAVLKVRHGIVQEVGIAVEQLAGSHQADRELMNSFD